MKIFDLCSGIGGFRLGVELSEKIPDYQVEAFSDNDDYAVKGYISMYNEGSKEVSLGDVQKYTRFENEYAFEGQLERSKKRTRIINETIPYIDTLFAGFPCQPHSLMGNRLGNSDSRGNLFYDIAEILRVKRPSHFVLENVKSLVSVNCGEFFKEIISILSSQLKYSVKTFIVNASDFGIPQTRRRVFIVGSLEKDISQLSLEPYKVQLSNAEYPTTWHLLEKTVDSKYYLSDKILKTILKSQHKGYSRKAEINKLIARPLTRTMHKMHRASQDNYYSDSYINGEYSPSKGIVIPAKVEVDNIRRITPLEALRIQSFPEDYAIKLVNSGLSDTRLYMLAGNAVPPKLVSVVLNALFEYP